MIGVYKLNLDCGRMGSLDGVFTADSDDVKKLIDSGKEVYFGEVLGKHSEVVTAIKKKDVTLVTTDKKFIELFDKFEIASGFNPFDYLDESDNDEEYEEDDEDDE